MKDMICDENVPEYIPYRHNIKMNEVIWKVGKPGKHIGLATHSNPYAFQRCGY